MDAAVSVNLRLPLCSCQLQGDKRSRRTRSPRRQTAVDVGHPLDPAQAHGALELVAQDLAAGRLVNVLAAKPPTGLDLRRPPDQRAPLKSMPSAANTWLACSNARTCVTTWPGNSSGFR